MNQQSPPAPVGKYSLVDGTEIRFRTRHLFGLAPVKGRFKVKSGSVVVDERPSDASANITIDAASFSTRNPMRDVQVRSRIFLNVKRHPTFEFRSHSITWNGSTGLVRGTLDVRGSQQPVELKIDEVKADASGLTFHARGEVDRYAHGVTAFKGMAARKITFEVTARADRL